MNKVKLEEKIAFFGALLLILMAVTVIIAFSPSLVKKCRAFSTQMDSYVPSFLDVR